MSTLCDSHLTVCQERFVVRTFCGFTIYSSIINHKFLRIEYFRSLVEDCPTNFQRIAVWKSLLLDPYE